MSLPLPHPRKAGTNRRLVHRLRRLRRALCSATAVALPATLLLIIALVLVLRRVFSAPTLAYAPGGDGGVLDDAAHKLATGVRVHDGMPSPSPWPAEAEGDVDDALYGTGREVCYALGDSGAEGLWQVNSRALCVTNGRVCFSGVNLGTVVSTERRGSGVCRVVEVDGKGVREATREEMGSSCARWRERRVMSMFGGEDFWGRERMNVEVRSKGGVRWVGGKNGDGKTIAIVLPKYEWSWNICHFNRIWQNVMFVVRNLERFVDGAAEVRQVVVYFRSKFDYSEHWVQGIRDATIPAVLEETGINVTVSKIRYDSRIGSQCLSSAILLGAEGRVDAYPFLNDTSTWSQASQKYDDHIPTIPHDALWLRSAVYEHYHLPPVGEMNESGDYTSIPLPPLVLLYMERSPRSKRRFDSGTGSWLDETLRSLSLEHGVKVQKIHLDAAMTLAEQVAPMRFAGMAVGIHGANLVNSLFMPPASALFEMFPYRYVRYYYSAGANSGMRYSFHEPLDGVDYQCSSFLACMFKYRESIIHFDEFDRQVVAARLERAMLYLKGLHRAFPGGHIPLRRKGSSYTFDSSAVYSLVKGRMQA